MKIHSANESFLFWISILSFNLSWKQSDVDFQKFTWLWGQTLFVLGPWLSVEQMYDYNLVFDLPL